MLKEIADAFLAKATKATIGNIDVDVVLDYDTQFKSDVTSYPVESGFSVADHVSKRPVTLSMTAIFTPAALHGGDVNRLQNVIGALRAIHEAGEPVTVVLRTAIYENMVMTLADLPRNVQDGICYKSRLEFVHVTRVSQVTEEIPEDGTSEEAQGSAGASEQDAGSAGQTEIGLGVLTASDIDTAGADYTAAGSIQSGKEITAQNAANVIKNTLGGRIRIASNILF